uniref:HipA-like C-terminal domain-containing protein n=1 Tax=Aliivibrio fischeri TaxID=668 RepID=H2ERT0_ALIFS|nr:HipA domain-containing protein [Aliivibrio fischeri]AEY78097.1 hypothetical protein [Aliivibrio fischeri]
MFPENKCLISLVDLTDKKRFQQEYTKTAVKELTDDPATQMRLPFTKDEFTKEKPKEQKGMSISGYQPKLSLVIKDHQFEVVDNEAQYILKPSPSEFPHLAENEHATMLVMKTLNFDIPMFGLTRFKKDKDGNEEKAFVIKRFDRTADKKAIHQEQLDAAMNIAEKYGKIKDDDEGYISYERVWKFLSQNIEDTLKLKQDFFRRIFTAYLLGNNDLHLRNFGVLRPEVGPDTLAPVYDYVSVAPYKDYITDQMALPLLELEEGGDQQSNGFVAYSKYSGYDFIQFGSVIGLKPKMTEKLMNDILKKIPAILEIYKNSFVSDEHFTAIKKWVLSIEFYANKRDEFKG